MPDPSGAASPAGPETPLGENAGTPAPASRVTPPPPGLLTPAGWTTLAAGVLVVGVALSVALAQRGASAAPAGSAPVPNATLASAQATSAGGSTVYRQVDPLSMAAQNNPALAAQMARNAALAAAGTSPAAPRNPYANPATRIEVEPSQGAGVVSQARGPSGAGSVVGRSSAAGPALTRGPAQGTAIAPRAPHLPDSPKP